MWAATCKETDNRTGIKPRDPSSPGSILRYRDSTMRPIFPLVVLAAIQAEGSIDVLSYLNRCRSGRFDDCLARDLVHTVDGLMDKNETYRLNRYLTVTVVNAGNRSVTNRSTVDRDPSDGYRLGTRLLDLFNALTVRYQPEEIEEVFEGMTNTIIYNYLTFIGT